MRVFHFLPIAVLSFAALSGAHTAASNAQNLEQKLQWARAAIDAHAVMRHFEPPAKSSATTWQVARIEGCTIELKETDHRESPDDVVKGDEIFGLSEDRVVTWTFDLGSLLPEFVMADTLGVPHLKIFAPGDVFHLKTEIVSRNIKEDGTTASTRNWSTTGNARNLWMYFDSPDADNTTLVRKLESDLRSAISSCSTQAHAR